MRTNEFVSDKFKALVECLAFHPKGAWLLASGGGDKDGFFAFIDPATGKASHKKKLRCTFMASL